VIEPKHDRVFRHQNAGMWAEIHVRGGKKMEYLSRFSNKKTVQKKSKNFLVKAAESGGGGVMHRAARMENQPTRKQKQKTLELTNVKLGEAAVATKTKTGSKKTDGSKYEGSKNRSATKVSIRERAQVHRLYKNATNEYFEGPVSKYPRLGGDTNG